MKTTPKQFDLFVKTCRKYVKLFGLYEWDLAYEHGKIEPGTVANCSSTMPQMSAVIRLNTERELFQGKLTNEEIKITAIHEVSHLLIAKLDAASRTRFLSIDEVIQHNEEIVNRVVSLVRNITETL